MIVNLARSLKMHLKSTFFHDMKISLVVPFYNEDEVISKTFEVLNHYMTLNYGSNYELIFVNDGSTDNSLQMLSKVITKAKRVRIISYVNNKGRGYALKKGFTTASGDLVGYIDSDLEIDEKYIKKCVNMVGKYDVAVISKHLKRSKVRTTLVRRSVSKFYNFWVRLILGSQVKDHQGGLKIFRKEVLKKALKETHSRGWLFDTEILYNCEIFGFKIGEVPLNIEYGTGEMRGTMIYDFFNS